MPIEEIKHDLKSGVLLLKVDQPSDTGIRAITVTATFQVATLPIIYESSWIMHVVDKTRDVFASPMILGSCDQWPTYITVQFMKYVGTRHEASNWVTYLSVKKDDRGAGSIAAIEAALRDEVTHLKDKIASLAKSVGFSVGAK